MGVEANITIESQLPGDQVEQAARACFDRLAQLDASFSDYTRDSELNNLTRQPSHTPVKVSDDLFLILSQAQHVSSATNGVFDITVGPYVALWRAARASNTLPTQAQLSEAKKRVGYRLIKLDAATKTVTLLADNMKLDLGGIAKGYAAEAGTKVLKAEGFPRCLVALAGDAAAGDGPLMGNKGEPAPFRWNVLMASKERMGRNYKLRLENASVSTSGDAEQFIDIGGIRYSHIVDPRTGLGAVGSVPMTVTGPNGALVDALATAFTLLDRRSQTAILKDSGGYTSFSHELPNSNPTPKTHDNLNP